MSETELGKRMVPSYSCILCGRTGISPFSINVKSVLLYGCETWKVTKQITDVTACSEFDSGQVTCDGHKLDFRPLIRFICKKGA
jgi:hypothetical protein